jgi:ferredoxin-like protein FixX
MSDKKETKTEAAAPAASVNNDIALGIALGMKQMAEAMGLTGHAAPAQEYNPKAEYYQRIGKGTCQECGQFKVACEGKHTEMVVFPTKYPEHAEFWPGVKLNAAHYISNNENHRVVVPVSAVPVIMRIIHEFEQNENNMKNGRTKRHNSGSISPGGAAVNSYRGGGFI